MTALKILSVFGTRPEAIKMAPLIQALSQQKQIESIVCVTGQHRQMLDQVIDLFNVVVDIDLDLMQQQQGLNHLFARLLTHFDRVLEEQKPDWVLVHGDTTTAAACAVAAFHRNIKIGAY